MELLFIINYYTFKVTTAQSCLKYLAILNIFLSTPGLSAKLMLVLGLVHLLQYLDINYPEEVRIVL